MISADPSQAPKAIFISAHNTAPLAADLDYVLSGQEVLLQKAVTALAALTTAKVHVSVSGNNAPMADLKDCEVHVVSGPHPAGLVGTQINKIDPINKGEVVWTLAAQDVLI